MFSSSNIYKLFKPENEPNLITAYEVIIGGTALTANFHKGVILVNVLSSKAVTSQYNDITKLNHDSEMDIYSISQSSYIETKYQIDIYKINAKNAQVIEAEIEAPFPRWQTITFAFSGSRPAISIALCETKSCEAPWKP